MVNRIVAPGELDRVGLAMANHIAAIDPDLVKQTKRAINRSFEARNMLEALEEGLAIDLAIEGAGSPDKIEFMVIARRDSGELVVHNAIACDDATTAQIAQVSGIGRSLSCRPGACSELAWLSTVRSPASTAAAWDRAAPAEGAASTWKWPNDSAN